MLTFFRRIRKGLMKDGATSKPVSRGVERYLLYAVGEIALVVIGILIALQINNWNEERKNKKFEVRMLVEVKGVLEGELDRFDIMIARMRLLDSTVHKFLPLAELNKTLPTELEEELKMLNIGVSFEYNPGPYTSIKNHGLDKISSDSLRTSLVHFYDYQYPRFAQHIISADRTYYDHRDRMRLYGVTQSIVPETGIFFYQREIPKSILKSDGFDELLLEISERANMVLYRVFGFKPEIEKMLELVNKELRLIANN